MRTSLEVSAFESWDKISKERWYVCSIVHGSEGFVKVVSVRMRECMVAVGREEKVLPSLVPRHRSRICRAWRERSWKVL